MYKTGDLARRLAGGELEFIGRRDGQVKFHGYRVELNEIQTALNQYPQIGRASCCFSETRTSACDGGLLRLAA